MALRALPSSVVSRSSRLFLLACAALLAPRTMAADSGVTTKLGFESAYVSYGTKFSENTFVPMLDAFHGDYYAGIWGYLPIEKGGGGYVFDGEWDFFAGRTVKLNKLVSLDLGGTIYQYPGVTTDAVTFEGFVWLNLELPLKPKLKLYYDFTISNWIGEVMIAHSVPLTKKTAFSFSGHYGFRQPHASDAWFYGTVKADWVYSITEKSQFSLGVRGTNNTDRASVGHGFEAWYGTAFGYSW